MGRFRDTELGIKFEMTADPWSRKVHFGDAFIGHLHFHPDHDGGEFRLELGPSVPLRLKVACAILDKAEEDESITWQRHQPNERPQLPAIAEPSRQNAV